METSSPLSEPQQRHLLTHVKYADTLLSEIEEILTAASSRSPFPKYEIDVTPAQSKVIRDYVARIRSQMLRVLEGQGIRPSGPQFGAIHCIRVTLAFVRIALTEIGPRYMRGFGEIPESAVADLNGLVTELNTLVDKLNAYLAQGLGRDLGARLEKLQWAGDEADLLRRIERVVSAQGLVEFRSKLAIILDRLETQRFEIAVFGQVSSGKSSLLNHVLRFDVLPVGVNPITAVPTRLVSGPEPRLTVEFADRRVERLEVTALPDFVTEQRNPGNAKGVRRIVVELPAARLSEGIVFVDTPGLMFAKLLNSLFEEERGTTRKPGSSAASFPLRSGAPLSRSRRTADDQRARRLVPQGVYAQQVRAGHSKLSGYVGGISKSVPGKWTDSEIRPT